MVSKVSLLRAFGKYCNGNIKTVNKAISLAGKNNKGYSVYSMATENGHTILAGFDKKGKPIRCVDIMKPKFDGTEINSYISSSTYDFSSGKNITTDSVKRNLKFSSDEKYTVTKQCNDRQGKLKWLSEKGYYLKDGNFDDARCEFKIRNY